MIRDPITLPGFQGAGEIVFRLISLPIPGPVIGLVLLLAFMIRRGKVVALCVQVWWQRGVAIGVAAHGIGTSRALSVNAEAGRIRRGGNGHAWRSGRGADPVDRRLGCLAALLKFVASAQGYG